MPEWAWPSSGIAHSKISKLAFSVPFSIISNKPTTTTEEFDAFHGFMLTKIYKTNLARRFALYSDLLYE